MKNFFFTVLLSLINTPALSKDQPAAEAGPGSTRVGALVMRGVLPIPAITGSYALGHDFFAEGTLGTIIAAGTANFGARYEFLRGQHLSPYFGLQTGVDYTVTESGLYYGASGGVRWNQLYLQVSPVYYYRRDFEKSRSYLRKASAMASIMYDFQSDGFNW